MTKTMYAEARWDGEIDFSVLKKHLIDNGYAGKKVAVFASVQFIDEELFRRELSDFEVLMTKAKRTQYVGQVLGCDSYDDAFEDDILGQCDVAVYIGDGKFHYKALLLAMGYGRVGKDLIVYDPTGKQVEVHNYGEMERVLKRIKGRILKLLTSDSVGILVSMKPGQCHFGMAELLRDKLQHEGKKVYMFVDNTFDFKHLEDYNFIDVWVNSACPRIGQDDDWGVVLNVREALDPEGFLEKLG